MRTKLSLAVILIFAVVLSSPAQAGSGLGHGVVNYQPSKMEVAIQLSKLAIHATRISYRVLDAYVAELIDINKIGINSVIGGGKIAAKGAKAASVAVGKKAVIDVLGAVKYVGVVVKSGAMLHDVDKVVDAFEQKETSEAIAIAATEISIKALDIAAKPFGYAMTATQAFAETIAVEGKLDEALKDAFYD